MYAIVRRAVACELSGVLRELRATLYGFNPILDFLPDGVGTKMDDRIAAATAPSRMMGAAQLNAVHCHK